MELVLEGLVTKVQPQQLQDSLYLAEGTTKFGEAGTRASERTNELMEDGTRGEETQESEDGTMSVEANAGHRSRASLPSTCLVSPRNALAYESRACSGH